MNRAGVGGAVFKEGHSFPKVWRGGYRKRDEGIYGLTTYIK